MIIIKLIGIWYNKNASAVFWEGAALVAAAVIVQVVIPDPRAARRAAADNALLSNFADLPACAASTKLQFSLSRKVLYF